MVGRGGAIIPRGAFSIYSDDGLCIDDASACDLFAFSSSVRIRASTAPHPLGSVLGVEGCYDSLRIVCNLSRILKLDV